MRIAAFTGGASIPSARFRVRQLIAPLGRQSLEVTEFCARFSSWPPEHHLLRYLWLLGTVVQRIPSVLLSHTYDLVLLQREMVSTLATLERFTGLPRVMDVDDAVWLHPRGGNFKRILQQCDAAICGNGFLADYVSNTVSRVLVLPTLVDTARFVPQAHPEKELAKPIIGWSGSRAGEKYLLGIENALKRVLDIFPRAVLRVVSDTYPAFSIIPPERVEFVKWSPALEVSSLQDLTIGLMPIDDTPWSRGKCSYKMLLYMSCGIPVVVSPFGMNQEVLDRSDSGFGVRSEDEWIGAICELLQDPASRHRLGENGRRVVQSHYSLETQLPTLVKFLREIAGRE